MYRSSNYYIRIIKEFIKRPKTRGKGNEIRIECIFTGDIYNGIPKISTNTITSYRKVGTKAMHRRKEDWKYFGHMTRDRGGPHTIDHEYGVGMGRHIGSFECSVWKIKIVEIYEYLENFLIALDKVSHHYNIDITKEEEMDFIDLIMRNIKNRYPYIKLV